MAVIEDINEAADRLSAALLACEKAVVFTGAGISTESGIPDYRSPGGIWSKMRPIQFDDFVSSEKARKEDWRRRFLMLDHFGNAKPNAGHLAIAEWVRAGIVEVVITQNIDGLHQRSGVPDDKVVELHGNGTYAKCLDCAARHEDAELRPAYEKSGQVPRCGRCGGLVKAAVISFGQAMPDDEMERAEAATTGADLFIAIGSSLVVYPAAGFPIMAAEMGARLILINGEETDLDSRAETVLRGKIGEILRRVVVETR